MKISAQVQTGAFRDVARRLAALEAAARDVLVPEARERFVPEARERLVPRPIDSRAPTKPGGGR